MPGGLSAKPAGAEGYLCSCALLCRPVPHPGSYSYGLHQHRRRCCDNSTVLITCKDCKIPDYMSAYTQKSVTMQRREFRNI